MVVAMSPKNTTRIGSRSGPGKPVRIGQCGGNLVSRWVYAQAGIGGWAIWAGREEVGGENFSTWLVSDVWGA